MNRKDFPLLHHHPNLVYLDSAATALKPKSVIAAEARYAEYYGTNAARSIYPLAEATDEVIRETREDIAEFIDATLGEIIFTHGTTDGINMLAQMFRSRLKSEDEILVTELEHHSNFLPWKKLSEDTGATLRTFSATEEGFLDPVELPKLVNSHTKVVALSLVSNVFGVINDISKIAALVRRLAPEAFIVVDAAQAISHIPISVQNLHIDALVFSGHKLYGSTGIGVLYLRQGWQMKLEPAYVGGGMVLDPLASPPVWKEGPEKFEAGTLSLGQIFGLRAAIHYVKKLGWKKIQQHEQKLLQYAFTQLESAFGSTLQILGTKNPEKKIGVVSMAISGIHPHDIASFLGARGIAVRAGTHCAAPIHEKLTLPATIRISFGLYTEMSDIDAFIETLRECVQTLSP